MGICTAEPPNEKLYEFNAYLFKNRENERDNVPIDANQLLLKGAILKNTRYVIGLVVYTGRDTKIMMNTKTGGKIKQSAVEKEMNTYTISLLVLQIFLCLAMAIAGNIWSRGIQPGNYFYGIFSVGNGELIKNAFMYFQLLGTLIPISLYVTIEVMKTMQSYFIVNDWHFALNEEGR